MTKKIVIPIIIIASLFLLTGCTNKDSADEIITSAFDDFSSNLYVNRFYSEDGTPNEAANTLVNAIVATVSGQGDWKFSTEDHVLTETGHVYFPASMNHTVYFKPKDTSDDSFVTHEQFYLYSLDSGEWVPISSFTWRVQNGEKVAESKTDFLDENNDWVENFR